jgi:DNA-binding NarL/FixJ family response regulator
VGLVLSERQAKVLLVYLDALTLHGAGRRAAISLRHVKVKISNSLAKLDVKSSDIGEKQRG